MVHHELLNDAEKDDDFLLQLFHEEVTTGRYPNQDLFGLKGLRCDEDCNIFYEGNIVATTNRRWLNHTKESMPWAKELHTWCLEQDQKEDETSYLAALMRDVPPERLNMTRDGKVKSGGATKPQATPKRKNPAEPQR